MILVLSVSSGPSAQQTDLVDLHLQELNESCSVPIQQLHVGQLGPAIIHYLQN